MAVLRDGVVWLRPWEVADAPWYAEIAVGDELIQRFTSEPADLTAEQVRAVVQDLPNRSDVASFVICDAATGERLGNIGLRHQDGVGDVSYWLAPAARGRGCATRALQLLSRWAFEALDLHELHLWAVAGNLASRLVAERAGYRRDPGRDQVREVKTRQWETVAYSLVAPAAAEAGTDHPAPRQRSN